MTNESKTLFIPLYGKAVMSREGFFEDKTAERIVQSEEKNLKTVDTSRKLAIYMAMRAMQYDELAEKFASKNHESIIIHIGCGLDSRINRVKSKPKMWYDLDFPEVIGLRKNYFTETGNYKMLGSPVMETEWLKSIPYSGEKVLIIAEGLTMYLSEKDIIKLISDFKAYFGNVTFIFDAYSPFAAKMSKYKNPINAVEAKIDFAMDDPKILENDNVKCILNSDIILKEYVDKLRGIDRLRFKFMGGAGKNMYRIFGYEITQ